MRDLNDDELIELYYKNYSATKISKMFDTNASNITYRLRKMGIKIRRRHRKYLINEDYFKNIDSSNKAYWIGFLLADGYNSGNFIRVDIQDKGHLEKLRDEVFINKDMPIREKNSPTNKLVYYLTIQNKNIVKDCEQHGIVKNKSFITKYPNIPPQFDRDFIRGLFDGDGCLTFSTDKNYRRYTLSIVGSENLIYAVKKKLDELNINFKIRKTRSIFEGYIRGNRQIIKCLNYMYEGSSVYLERKYQKYDELITWDGTKREMRINKIINQI